MSARAPQTPHSATSTGSSHGSGRHVHVKVHVHRTKYVNEDSSPAPDYSRYIAEFFGTYLLVFTVGCNVLSGSPTWGVTSIAAVLMVCIYAVGNVSGGNFNPAVSVALGLSGKLAPPEVAKYCALQCLAGVCAALSYGLLFWEVFPLAPGAGFSWMDAYLMEFLYTFFLCFVVLNAAASCKNGCATGNQFYGLAIGFVVIAGGYGAGAISGGCFNPAVALGIDVSGGCIYWGCCHNPPMTGTCFKFGGAFAYIFFELLGACLAAALFRVVRPDDFGGSPDYDRPTKCIAEGIGTYMLVLTVGLNVLAGSPAAAFSIAAALMCMIYALGDVSGAHFNPAVSLAILHSGREKLDSQTCLWFIGAQCLGGVLGAITYALCYNLATFALGPQGSYGWIAVLFGEFIFTFLLCFVVLSVATVHHPLSQYFGLAIGACVIVGGFAIGKISGGSLNPAVTLGICMTRVLFDFRWFPTLLLYVLAELGGALFGAYIFKTTHPSEYESPDPLGKGEWTEA